MGPHKIGIKLYTFVKIGAENIVSMRLDAENGDRDQNRGTYLLTV